VNGDKDEVAKYASCGRIHFLCYTRMTQGCNEPVYKCGECFEKAKAGDGYMCYPFDKAILRKGQTDKFATRGIEDIHWEERNGKTWFVFKLKEDGQ
jgi:hypothetical protein